MAETFSFGQLGFVPSRARSVRERAAVAIAVALVLSACGTADGHEPLAVVGHPSRLAQPSDQTGDGFIPEGQSISPFDDADPALSNLDPDLRSAMQRAAADARNDGIDFQVNSGWRSARYQQMLLNRAISSYGSEQTARRYVSTPEKSAHVKGKAVDIGPTDADSWLSQHGFEYGLCQTYANERWHFELSTVPGGSCPAMIADASAG
jgi:D-alanyl-D-alanine carboxypeptidase